MRARSYPLLCLMSLILSLMGCGGSGHEKFIPSVQSAREALDEALRAWKEGQPYKAIDSFEPAIQPVESRWQQGKKLVEYEIVKELEVEGPKQFQVKLKLEGDQAPAETTYVVLGKDPLYVYWLTDYEQSSKTM